MVIVILITFELQTIKPFIALETTLNVDQSHWRWHYLVGVNDL